MFPLRNLFPSFERPSHRPRYLNIETARGGRGRVIGGVALLGVACALALTLTQPDASPVAEIPSAQAAASPAAPVNKAKLAEAPAAAVEKPPAAKVWASCAQKTTARRECAMARAAKEAKLTQAAEPVVATVAAPSPLAVAATAPAPKPAASAPKAPEAATTALASASDISSASDEAAAPAAPVRKAKKIRKSDELAAVERAVREATTERLVRVYDEILPDGRRIPVYRRSNGRLEFGTVVGGQYRPSRTVELFSGRPRFFGLQ